MSPLFFSQKIEAKDPEKKIPSTAAKATTLSPENKDLLTQTIKKKYTYNNSTLTKRTKLCIFVTNPVKRPIGLPLYTRHRLNGIEKIFSTRQILKRFISEPMSKYTKHN